MENTNNTQSFDIQVKSEIQTDDCDSLEGNKNNEICEDTQKIQKVEIKVENTEEDFFAKEEINEELIVKVEPDFTEIGSQENIQSENFLHTHFSTETGSSFSANKNDLEATSKALTPNEDIIRIRQSKIDEPFKCNRKNLEIDTDIHTNEESNCQKYRDQHPNLTTFMHSCKKSYICDVCEKIFNRKENLKKHKFIHTGEKPYACNMCTKTFNQSNNLKNHKLTHTGEKPYMCDVCKKIFSRKDNLKKHELVHTGERPHICDVCKKTFTRKGDLNKHKLTHTGEKPYVCNMCTKSFNQSNNLKNHKLIHTGEKPYECDVCKKTFNLKTNLKKHILIYTGKKPHTCDVCKKTFLHKTNLNKHKRIHTR